MANSINRVVVFGHLGRDPELKHTQGGVAVASFSIACNSREKDASGEWGDRVDWFDVTVWGNEGEACSSYLHKGSHVGIEGRLRQERWKNKAGENRYAVRIIATSVQFLDPKEGDRPSYDEPEYGGDLPDDDIPF